MARLALLGSRKRDIGHPASIGDVVPTAVVLCVEAKAGMHLGAAYASHAKVAFEVNARTKKKLTLLVV